MTEEVKRTLVITRTMCRPTPVGSDTGIREGQTLEYMSFHIVSKPIEACRDAWRRAPDEVEDPESPEPFEWEELVGTRSLTLTPEGLEGVLVFCNDTHAFETELKNLLERVWYLGRAFERMKSRQS